MHPLKKEIILLLNNKQYGEILSLSGSVHKIINILVTLSYNKTDQLAWRAMEAAGLITKEIAKAHPDIVRNIVGRLLWMMRDESGGIAWSAPEILGEIVRNNPELCADIAPILVSFHDEKMLTAGVLRAIGRIGDINNETTGYAVPNISPYLDSPDCTIRGYAIFALGSLEATGAIPSIEGLRNDDHLIDYYEDGELNRKTVGAIAEETLSRLRKIL